VCSSSAKPCTSTAATTTRSSAALVADLGIELVCSRVRKRAKTRQAKKAVPLGLRWPIERTNSWLSNFGQLRPNTDRSVQHRLAQLSLAVALLLAAKLIDWRNRWNPS
jgi:hypothetical protein